MATIPTLQIPQMGAVSGGADFAPLAQLGNIYAKARQDEANKAAFAQFQQTGDPRALIGSGDMNLAQLGANIQNQQALRAQTAAQHADQVSQFNQQQAIRDAAEKRAAAADEEDTVEGRKKKLATAGIDLNDPLYKGWLAAGGTMPTPRVGLGQPVYTRDTATGKLTLNQQSSAGGLIPTTLPPGQEVLGPGEVAAQKQEAVSMAKAKAAAATSLPKLADQVATNMTSMDELATHKGRDNATGKWRGQLADDSTLLSQEGIDFRNRFKNVKGQAFLSAFDTLRGAGAISNSEGDAAKAAINRLSTVTSKDEFDAALKEAKGYYQLGLNRARRAAKGDFSEHPAELRPSDYASSGNRAPLTDIFK